MSTWMRAEPAMRTRESQSRNIAWSRTSRPALTRNRWRWRPRKMASGAGAGPSTVTPGSCGAARASARAVKSQVSLSAALTINAASRPKGGSPAWRRAAGSAADLMQQLIGPLGGAQIAAGKPEIGIDHADQGQHRKMVALGDDLGPDQHVVAPLSHRLGELGCGARSGQEIADHQRCAGSRKP